MPKISEDLIEHTTYTTSEERRFNIVIGRTEFVTSEESRIEFSRHWRSALKFNKTTIISFA
jgi:hypothetical protein